MKRYRVCASNELHVGVAPEGVGGTKALLGQMIAVPYKNVKWLDEGNGYRGCTPKALLVPTVIVTGKPHLWQWAEVSERTREALERLSEPPAVWYTAPPSDIAV